MDAAQFIEAAKAAIDEIVEYNNTLGDRPSVVSTVEPGYLRKLLPGQAPEQGEAWDAIHKDMERAVMPGITHWNSPNFFAFYPCPSSYPSILGELYSATYSTAAFNWICSPAVTELETIVLDWVAKLFGFPESYLSTGSTQGGGVILGTASESTLTMMIAARDLYLQRTVPRSAYATPDAHDDALAARRGRLVALASACAHSGSQKAAKILGLRFRAVFGPGPETDYALTGAHVAAALQKCKDEGLEPFFLGTTMGTTDTAAVDRFGEIADVLERYREGLPVPENGCTKPEVWVHVDAAYAGSALICPEHQVSSGLPATADRLHSFNTNMHKWMLTNFDASLVWVRNRRWLVDAMGLSNAHNSSAAEGEGSVAAATTPREGHGDLPILHNAFSATGLVTDYRDWQIALGRRFKALKVWFVLRSYGAEGLRAHIRRCEGLSVVFAEGLRERSDLFRVVTGPKFALTVFCVRGEGEAGERRTREVYERVNASGRLWCTSTVLDGKTFAIRINTANESTKECHVRAAVELFVETAEEVIGEEVEV